jgi:hypothetical protein
MGISVRLRTAEKPPIPRSVPKTIIFGTSPRTVEIDISPAGLLFVLLDLFMHHHNTYTRDSPPVQDRG